MIRRLVQRKKLVIGGCIFAAVILGAACTGVVHAAQFDMQTSATGDSMVSSSSEWAWAASDGDLSHVPPLAIGQEVIRGGYSGSVLVAGPCAMTTTRGLSTDEILEFSTDQKVESQAPGILSEALSVNSVGSPATGVTCGSDSLDADGANLTRQAYCEHAGSSTLFLADVLNYRSAGGIRQGDIDVSDSMMMEMEANGHGSGMFSAGSRSMIGIGNTSAPGYAHSASENIRTAGEFIMQGKTKWSSFANTF